MEHAHHLLRFGAMRSFVGTSYDGNAKDEDEDESDAMFLGGDGHDCLNCMLFAVC
jgi:hypothetical protein